ncbi:MAG: class I SAM-dependent methyltransferase [Phormidesmis sp.]
MSVFSDYARYYDLLYRDKDYMGETKFIHDLIQIHAPQSKTILELGCGTGNHALLLAEEGYHLHGVDLSQEMLVRANQRLAQLSSDLRYCLQFSHGDIREVRLNQTFDIILSLFHVISYQTTNADLLAAFNTAKSHLIPGGFFIFDVWYGPAVLNNQPVARIKRLENEAIQVTRIAEPILYPNENLVDVNYQVFIREKNSNKVSEVQEKHRMRYLFKQELDLLLKLSGLRLLDFSEWMTGAEASINSWGVCCVAQNELPE